MLTQVEIDHLTDKGIGIGYLPDSRCKVEVAKTLPQEQVLVELGRKRRKKCKGFLRTLLVTSSLRTQARCMHAQECGGCSLQQMAYEAQLQLKEARIKELFSAFPSAHLFPIIPSPAPFEYRNKMEFSFSQNKAGERFLGLMLEGTRGYVFNVQECHLTAPWITQALHITRQWWEKSDSQAYHPHKDEGSLRTLIVREGKVTSDKMAFLTVSGNPRFALSKEQLQKWQEQMSAAFPNISLFLRIQQLIKGKPTQFYEMHLAGKDHITEKLEINLADQKRELTFKISPTSFFQPNTLQACSLYSKALQLANLSSDAHVLDLYCGTGTLSLIFALKAAHVTGIELNPHAIFDARVNSEENAIHNVEFICGDVGSVLQQRAFATPDLVLLDPPRSGLDPLALSHLLALKPKKILYISCNPKTQSADVAALCKEGYKLLTLQPIDQFPHTVHIENIALLERQEEF